MYSRYPNYRFGGIKIPENYSGNAFSEPLEKVTEQGAEAEMSAEMEEHTEIMGAPAASVSDKSDTEESLSAALLQRKKRSPFGFNFNLGRLFSGGFGFEELLLIAIILLVSQNDSGDDLILFLALLLFVG